MRHYGKNCFHVLGSTWAVYCACPEVICLSLHQRRLPAQSSSCWWSRLSQFDSTSNARPSLLSWCEGELHQTRYAVLSPTNVIPRLIVFPRRYLCRLFLPWTNSKHVCLWSSIPGLTVICSLNRGLVLAGKKISEAPGRDQVSVIPWARRRLSGSPGWKNSWEENNVSKWMPVKCVSWWEGMFSLKSRHNKQWLKAYKQPDDDG